MCPRAATSRGQRHPSSRSAPTRRSSPPPVGSRSTSTLRRPERAATNASPAANVEVPTPPEPPVTQISRPDPDGRRLSSAIAPDSHRTLPGTTTTAAPRAIDNWYASGAPPVSASRYTSARRGSRSSASAGAWSTPTSSIDALLHRARRKPGSLATSASKPAAATTDRAWSSSSGFAVLTTIVGSPAWRGSMAGVCGRHPGPLRRRGDLWTTLPASAGLWTTWLNKPDKSSGMTDMLATVRRFNRTVTQQVGALDDRFLAQDRPLAAALLL